MSQLLDACESACFSCADVLTKKEFLTLALLYAGESLRTARSIHELYTCLTEAGRRGKETARQFFKKAISDRILWSAVVSCGAETVNLRLTALSPSDEMGRRCVQFMLEAYEALLRGAAPDRMMSVSPNQVAVALRLDIGPRSILLGSDLEDENDPLVGWSAVLNSELSRERKSETFKVAHHGSKSGHLDGVWTDLLHANPLSLLTPFRYGRHELPTVEDRARILALTNRAYISAHPHRRAKPKRKRVPKVEALINSAAKGRRQAAGPVGHIRWRANLLDAKELGTVELADGAIELASVDKFVVHTRRK
jgi:hypothetical protein